MKLVFTFLSSFLFLNAYQAQVLGIYEFTGTGACPNQNPNVSAQPAGATFSAITSVGTTCVVSNNVYNANDWNPATSIDPTKYHQLTVTADNGKVINLDSLIFASRISSNTATWHVRSSVDNFANDLFSGSSTDILDTARLELPAGFTSLTSVEFRFYVSAVTDNQRAWRIDDITFKGTITNNNAGLSKPAKNQFSLFPNPGTDELIIQAEDSAPDLNIRIFTVKGKMVTEAPVSETGTHIIITSKFESGVYFIELSGREGTTTQRWIKQ